jgi:hypothetical protein
MTHYSKYKDFILRKKFKNYQSDILLLKFFLLKEKLPKNFRFKIMLKLQQLHSGLLGVKYKNRCMISTKVRSVSKISNLNKSAFREYLR